MRSFCYNYKLLYDQVSHHFRGEQAYAKKSGSDLSRANIADSFNLGPGFNQLGGLGDADTPDRIKLKNMMNLIISLLVGALAG